MKYKEESYQFEHWTWWLVLLVQIQNLANNKGSQEVSISCEPFLFISFKILFKLLLIHVCWAASDLQRILFTYTNYTNTQQLHLSAINIFQVLHLSAIIRWYKYTHIQDYRMVQIYTYPRLSPPKSHFLVSFKHKK